MNKKLTTKIQYSFQEQNDFPELNINMNLKTRRKLKHIKILEHKKKKKVVDPSTKLF
jgi:hypothetical protein